MQIATYSDKSFVVHGKDTRTYREQLKNLGGRFNRYLKPREEEDFEGGPGWIFSNKQLERVQEFLTRLSDHQEGEPPVVVPPSSNGDRLYQTVAYKLRRPQVGTSFKVSATGTLYEGEITQVEEKRGSVVRAYSEGPDQTLKFIISDGKWQVWMLSQKHFVRFM